MKIVIIILCLFAINAGVCAQADSSTCLKFRTGNFAYRNDSTGLIHIKRTLNKQQETNRQTGVITKFKIKWLDACSYQIKQIWSNSKTIRKQNGAVTKVLITAASADSYQFTCACANEKDISRNSGTVVLITW